jgi:8-oxo-dGTP pyrophosphatase MutT (NUDIX family)
MKPTRAVGIVIRDNVVLLMHRIKNGKEYYVFPGGGVEENESVEEAVLREVLEETTLKIKVGRKIYLHDYGESSGHYYLCDYIEGEPQLGDSIEKEIMEMGKGDYYNPLWVNIDKLEEMLVYPLEVRDWLIADLKNGFSKKVRAAKLRISELRQTLERNT